MPHDANDEAPKTLSVPEAGWLYYRLSKNGSYEAARRGDLPVIRIGARMRVPIAAMERKLAEAGQINPTEPRKK